MLPPHPSIEVQRGNMMKQLDNWLFEVINRVVLKEFSNEEGKRNDFVMEIHKLFTFYLLEIKLFNYTFESRELFFLNETDRVMSEQCFAEFTDELFNILAESKGDIETTSKERMRKELRESFAQLVDMEFAQNLYIKHRLLYDNDLKYNIKSKLACFILPIWFLF
jgi:hypothetical protein